MMNNIGNTKFLYCKYDNLKEFINNGASLRFTDINHYINLENKKIRDDESRKSFLYTPDNIIIEINGFKIPSNDMAGNVEIKLPTERSHVLCLSNSGNEKKLFERFEADTCIEINIDLLIQIIKDGLRSIGECAEVEHKKVFYYKINSKRTITNPRDLVFCKPHEMFYIEDEYRIAIFYPYKENTYVKTPDDNLIQLFGNHHYIEIGINDDIGMKRIIVEARCRDGTLIK